MARKRKLPDWRKIIDEHKIIAMVRTGDEKNALRAAAAALKGGIKVIEITLNTPGALAVIRELSEQEDIFLGAGSVRSVKAAKAALKAGARFIVSPHFDRRIVSFVARRGLLCVAGAATPSEAMQARERGAGLIKVFPAEQLGGVAFVRALLAPLPDLPLVPTGGVGPKNIQQYLAAGAVAVGLGSAVFKPELIMGKNFKGVTTAAEHMVDLVRDAKAVKKR